MKVLHRIAAIAFSSLFSFSSARAEPPENVLPTPAQVAEQIRSRDWWALIEKEIPPLQHELGDRWPLIAWTGPGFAPLPPEKIRLLLARGITQHIPLDTAAIPTALALQRAGSKVIVMEGRSGNWPYSLVPDSSRWALQFDEGYTYEMAGDGPLGKWHSAVPVYTEGWAIMADQLRTTLRAFRDAGVTIDGLWMDYETDPYPFAPLFEQWRHCRVSRQFLPPEVLTDRQAWFAYCWRLYTRLYDAYLAAPTLEIFPRCAVTNWHIVFSSPADTVFYFVDNRFIPPVAPTSFTASNPVAYGNDKWFLVEWRPEYPLDRRHVDQFYLHNLLRQVSADAANRLAFAPHAACFPWVARWCPILGDPEHAVPDMSRPAYREALRHLWLRGVTGMQVFNPRNPQYEAIWLQELQDVVAVYDEVLAYREFLDQGEVMNLEVPPPQHDGVFWSGLRLADRALVRLTNQSDQEIVFPLEPWPGHPIALSLPADSGRTFLLERVTSGVRVVE